MTQDMSKDIKFSETSQKKSCIDYFPKNDYDICIGTSIRAEIGRRYKCSLPFLKSEPMFPECRVDVISDAERKILLDAFVGNCVVDVLLLLSFLLILRLVLLYSGRRLMGSLWD
jgi:hypothetical protein